MAESPLTHVSAGPLGSSGETSRVSRAALSSLIATAADAGTVLLLSLLVSVLPLAGATLLGCAVGALLNFNLNRSWAFQAQAGPWAGQALKYVLVSASSALLNAALVHGLVTQGALPDVAAWLFARGLSFLIWTYPLFRWYVFSSTRGDRDVPSVSS